MSPSAPDRSAAHRPRRSLPAAPFVGAALPALALYLATLCPTVYVSGTGENIAAAAVLGVPHPPGFPLFCLLGRVSVLAAPVAPAAAVNLLAATCMAAAAGLLAWIVARWTRSLVAGVAGGLLFAVARVPWSQAVIGEVYGLSALLLAAELALVLACRGDLGVRLAAGGRARLLLLLAFVLGVGVSVHPLHALMMPGYLLLLGTAPHRPPAWRILVAGALLAVLGYSLQLYTPLRSALDPGLDWGNPETGPRLWAYLTASQYRERMFSLGAAEALDNLGHLGRLLVKQWTAPALLLPLGGVLVLVWRHARVATGLALMALVDVLYAINYDIPWEIEVYYIPLILVLSVAGGAAVAARAGLLAPAAAVVCALAVWAHAGVAGRRGVDLVDAYGRDVLDALPPGAVLITPPTNPTFILLYLTQVEGARPDLDVYVAGEHGHARLGEALAAGEQSPLNLWSLATDAGRPLFYAERAPLDDLPGFRLQPAGIVYRVTRAGDRPEAARWRAPRVDPASVAAGDDFRLRLIAARYLLARSDHRLAAGDSAAARDDREAATRVAGDRAELHGGIALRLAAEGDRRGAIAAYRRALELREDAVLINRLGRLLVEAGDRDRAEEAFRRSLVLEPDLAIAHSNLGALLGARGDFAGAVAELRLAVAADPRSIKAYNNLGRALLARRDREGAVQAFRRSLDLNPDQPRIARRLGELER